MGRKVDAYPDRHGNEEYKKYVRIRIYFDERMKNCNIILWP